VADGVYKPTATNDRGVSFNIGLNNLKVYGGFQGISHPDGPETEDDIEDRNPLFFESVLSGDIGVQGDHSDNSIHVVVIAGVDNDTVLDGFTIRDGNGQVNNAVARPGGGLFMDNSAARIVRCTFVDNSTHVPNGETSGGAAYAFGHCGGCGGAPWFINCTFRSNVAPKGGALAIQGSTDIVHLVNCVFQDNVATMESGGALLLLDGGRASIINSTFTENSAPTTAGGGAIALLDNTVELQIHNSILWDDSPNEIDNPENVKVTISYSDVEGGADGIGNIDTDPSSSTRPPVTFDFRAGQTRLIPPSTTTSPTMKAT
jgi:hypothetical protein